MAKNTDKKKKRVFLILSAFIAAALIVGICALIYTGDAVQYSKAINMIEEGNFKDGYDKLTEMAEKNESYADNYKDTNELLYTRAIELIETGVLKNKQAAYKMLTPISGYKNADEIMYYLWVEDVYDPDDDNTFEQADQFMSMIPEDYDGPFAKEIVKFRNDIKESVRELTLKKYKAAMESEGIENPEELLQ